MMRRLLVALLVCATAAGAFTSGGTAAAQQEPPPTVNIFSMTPYCGPQNQSTRVSLSGAANRPSVTISIFAPSGAAAGGPYTVQVSDGGWSTALPLSPTQLGEYEFRVSAATATRSGYYRVPCVAPVLRYDPGCFVVGSTSTVTMTAQHFPPFSAGYMYYDLNGSEAQTQIRLPVDGHGTFSATFKVAPAARDHPGRGQNNDGSISASAVWSPCPPPTTAPSTTTTTPTGGGGPTTTTSTSTTRPGDPPPSTTTTIPTIVTIPTPTPGAVLLVTPSLGPGGFVATALGSGFPPNALVTLGWSPGIGIFGTLTRPDGTFSTPALVMHRDVLGPRTLVASSGGVAATASFLVVPSTVQPSGKDVAQITRVRRFLQR